jgi:hypothetical protein
MAGNWIDVSLPAVVAFGHYGGVGSLCLLKKDRIQHPVSGIQDPSSALPNMRLFISHMNLSVNGMK